MFLSVNDKFFYFFFYLQFYYMKPNNNFSQYFDSDFNFNNIVYPSKLEMVDKLKYMSCDGNIMLEPRLQEYLKKRKFYKDNDIEPCISPEKEYQITSTDLKILRKYLGGDKNIYETKKFNKLVEQKDKKRYFPSKGLRNDPRVPQIEKQKNKTRETPINMGMFAPEFGGRHYENPIRNDNAILDARDFPTFDNEPKNAEFDGNGFNLNETRFNPRIDPRIEPGIEKHNKYNSQYRKENRSRSTK